MSENNRLPRLCFVGPMVGVNPGFVVTHCEKLAANLKDIGYSVSLVSTSTNRYIRLVDILVKILRWRKSVDVLVIEVYSGPSFVISDLASRLGCALGLPIIMVLQGGALPQHIGRFPRWTKKVLRRADAVVAPSPYLARSVNSFEIPAKIIPNLINVAAYTYRHRSSVQPYLFWMRSFHEIYNPKMSVRVLARVRSRNPHARLVMAGQEKGLQAEVRRYGEDQGIAEAVHFPGFLDAPGKSREAERSDIFINTNRIDNTPMAVVEACAFGLPVVATSVGGIPDLLQHEETALLVPDDDDQAMADAVERLIEDPELASRLSRNGRRLAESSSWKAIRPQWEDLFKEVTEHQR